MEKWFQREIITATQSSVARGNHKRQSIRDLHRELKKAGIGAKGSVWMYEQPTNELGHVDPIVTLIHQAEVTKRGRVKPLEL